MILPPSRDRDDAWRLVVDMLAAPLFEMAMSHKAAQRARAKRPRSKVGEDGETIAGIIKKLLNNEETIDLKPKELWPHLYAALDSAGLGPKEVKHETDFKKIAYAYETAAGIRKISFGRFTSIISEPRRGKKSRQAWSVRAAFISPYRFFNFAIAISQSI